MSWPWSVLGLPGPSSLAEVRRAYAERLKTTHPEDDPEGFQRLHAAYQQARRLARQRDREQSAPPPEQTAKSAPEPPAPRSSHLREQKCFFQEEEPSQAEEPGAQDFDFDELLQGEAPPRRTQGGKDAEQDFDFDELLQGEAPPRRTQGGKDAEQDFDFDELLQEEVPPRRTQGREDAEQDFDFDELLQEEAPPRRTQGREDAEQDFDFERLFAEGEAERAEERRRRGEERRNARMWERLQRQQRYEQERSSQFQRQQERWQSTEMVLHTIEMMHTAKAGKESWQRFFESPLFRQNKGSLDLIFGLEDFFGAHPDWAVEAQLALYRAYGFDKEPVRPELRLLQQMLLPAWQDQKGRKRRPRTRNSWRKASRFLMWLGAFSILCILTCVLELGLIYPLGYLAGSGIVWVLREAVRLGNQERRARGEKVSARQERQYIICVLVVLAAFMTILSMPKLSLGDRSPDAREEVCRYMELDYGTAFQSLYNQTKEERYANVFTPEGEAEHRFLAGPNGTRSAEAGRLGYTTNYSDMKVLWALKDFCQAHGLEDLDLMNRSQGLSDWETSGTYLIVLPYYGAGETIRALGELLAELTQEDWYQFQTPVFQVVLCGEQMADGRLILQEYQSGEDFDAQGLRELYESSFAHSYAAQVIQECGLDRDFTRSGSTEHYTLTNEGMAWLQGKECCKLFGLDEAGQIAMEYYFGVDGGAMYELYCVPGGFWDAGGREDQIHFYRLVHREAGLGLITLCYPWLVPN